MCNSKKTAEDRGCGGSEQIKRNHRRNILLLLDGESEGGIRARFIGHFPTRLWPAAQKALHGRVLIFPLAHAYIVIQ